MISPTSDSIDPRCTYESAVQECKALEQAIVIVDNARLKCAGENHYAWDRMYRVGDHLRAQREQREKVVRMYFDDPAESATVTPAPEEAIL